jgi:hypothetical protein
VVRLWLDWILAQRDPNDPSRPLIEAVNMSVAKTGSDDADCGNTNRDILHQAICRLYRAGITVVAAAANASRSAAGFVPAAYNEAITVSALADTDGRPGGGGGNKCYSWGTYDRDDTFADFSNYGSDVDLIAPGKCILSTKPGPTYAYSSGTSMAAPHVTGAVALYKASRRSPHLPRFASRLRYLGKPQLVHPHRPRPVPRAIAERVAHRFARHVLGLAGSTATISSKGGTVNVPVQRVPQLDVLRARPPQRVGRPERLDRLATGAEPVRLDGHERDRPADGATERQAGDVSRAGHRDELGPDQVRDPRDQRCGRHPDRTGADRDRVQVEHARPLLDRRDDGVDARDLGGRDRPVRHDRSLRGRAKRQWRSVRLDDRDERVDERGTFSGLAVGAAHRFRVRAEDSDGSWSQWALATASLTTRRPSATARAS